MFNPVRLARLEAIVPRGAAGAALETLAASGEAELVPEREVRPAPPGRWGAAAARAAALLRSLDLPAVPAAEPGTAPEAALAAVERLEGPAAAALEKRRLAAAALAAAVRESERLAPYAGLPVPVGGGGGPALLRSFVGTMPAENLLSLRPGLPPGTVLAPLGSEKGLLRLLVLGGPDWPPAADSVLRDAGFRPEEFPGPAGATLGALAAAAAAREEELRRGLAEASAALAELAERARGGLGAAAAALARAAALEEARGSLGGTDSAALISAWVPASSAAGLAARVSAGAGGLCVAQALPPAAGEDVPVLLRQPRWLRPFAALVSAYGLPRYGEADPTPFAAAAFLLMFGMMFGDAGHGAVVLAAGLLLGRGPDPRRKAAGRVMAACGVSACLFGLLYGSFFGLESFRRYALWRDPLEGDPLGPLLAAAAFGAAVISLGVGLNVANRARNGDYAGALLGRFGAAGLLFYWAALAWAAGLAGPRLALPLMGLGAAGWLARGPAERLLSGGRGPGEGFAAGAAEAAVGAFEGALLYLANTVSFVRLAAYAMSHAALTAAAYALRDAADRAFGPGSAAGLAAVVLGNAAAIGLEGLVAGVQALRLEYYEFFGKFLEGAGRPFRPLRFGAKGEL